MKFHRALALFVWSLPISVAFAQQPRPEALNPRQASRLAELMCQQLPNVALIPEVVEVSDAKIPALKAPLPKAPTVWDDTYDTLVGLGRYSVPCLVDRLADTRWMPDPRAEPLLGVPVEGDVAYMILLDKGVPDLLPALAHLKPEKMTMGDWFLWSSVAGHRLLLQRAVRSWVSKHPNCCQSRAKFAALPRIQPKPIFRMSSAQFDGAQARFSRLQPGMSPAQILKIAGKPDAIDSGEPVNPPSLGSEFFITGLCADRNENLAYIYFIERWTSEVGKRDPLRDRYVILFFSAVGKFTRMFSNVAGIPPKFSRVQGKRGKK